MTRQEAEQQAQQLENASKLLGAELEIRRARMTAFARKSENEHKLILVLTWKLLDDSRSANADLLNAFLDDHRAFAQSELELMELEITKLESSIAVQTEMAKQIRAQLGASRLAVPGIRA